MGDVGQQHVIINNCWFLLSAFPFMILKINRRICTGFAFHAGWMLVSQWINNFLIG
jgi:hypothetical protein